MKMSQSLATIVVHLIFGTKARQRVLIPEIRLELFNFMASSAKRECSHVYEVDGVEDHVHMLVSLPRTLPLSKLVEVIKKESSRWLKKQHSALQLFSWQNGYGAFSVSASQIPAVRRYIQNQEKHHRQTSFQDELRAFLTKSNVSFDEKYLWD